MTDFGEIRRIAEIAKGAGYDENQRRQIIEPNPAFAGKGLSTDF